MNAMFGAFPVFIPRTDRYDLQLLAMFRNVPPPEEAARQISIDS